MRLWLVRWELPSKLQSGRAVMISSSHLCPACIRSKRCKAIPTPKERASSPFVPASLAHTNTILPSESAMHMILRGGVP